MRAEAGNPLNLRTRIKICGLTREQDVDSAVAAGADAVGFVLYDQSPRFVGMTRAADLAQRLPPFVTPVLLFVNESPERVMEACEFIPGATIQFHGDETPAECLEATAGGRRPYIRVARIPLDDSPFDLLQFASEHARAQAILLDAHVEGYGGAGKAFNWSRIPASAPSGSLEQDAARLHLVLSGGLTPANVTDGIVQVRPRCRTLAVDVSSGVEVSKGIKDPEKINQFVAAVRAADALLAKTLHGLLSTT
jgi:phosphoribosylanthranilate isomerase